jgi:hypothetical protein
MLAATKPSTKANRAKLNRETQTNNNTAKLIAVL